MHNIRLTVLNEVGLHARPAAEFVKQASKFVSTVQIRNLTRRSNWVDAKSILAVLTLGVEKGHEIEIRVEGLDEQSAILPLKEIIESAKA